MLVTRTYLELPGPADFRPPQDDAPGFSVSPASDATPSLYRHLYGTVGEPHHWRDRAGWTDEQLAAHLALPEITIHVARQDATLAGWYELRAESADESVEIAYLGLVPGAVGRGLGKHLLACAVRDAWHQGARRVWLHTCTLDHPHALPNYRARGFRVFRTEEYEVAMPGA